MNLKATLRVDRTVIPFVLLLITQQVIAQHVDSIDTAPQNNKSQKSDNLKFDEIVVTAAADKLAKMEQSLSVSSLDAAQISATAAANSAELLRAIPGVRSESSGGEGNANITVRGLPISAGGARYVQLQEDGLPVLQFGDIAFATADEFVRVDSGIDRIEVVRGGSASILATNSPGGVVNFISKTGEKEEGAVGVIHGLDFERTRYEFHYGQPFADSRTRFFVAGFYRQGEGLRDAGVNVEAGGQVRGNVTHEFANGNVRLNFKHVDDHVPMQMPVPVTTSQGDIHTLPGIDPRTASFYSRYWVSDRSIDSDNEAHFSDVKDGLHVKSNTLGVELSVDLGNGFSIEDKFRHSNNSGRFIAIFPADNAYTSGPFTYATGPLAGQAYAGHVFTATVFNTSLDDLGNTINDFKIKKTFALPNESDLSVLVGLYHSTQQVDLTWNFSQYLLQADGHNPVLIANAATSATTPGLIAQGTDVWGGCCTRNIDSEYTTTSPYLNVALRTGAWNFDVGVRRDRQRAEGEYNLATNQTFAAVGEKEIDYSVSESSYSLGVNYLVTDDFALFSRLSKGYTFNADRIMFNDFALDGSVPIPVNQVKQFEGGAKWRADPISIFITYFNANTEETNYEATTQLFTTREYDAQGVELESVYARGDFRLSVGITYTDAEISHAEDSALKGNSPRRQADWTYQIIPTYRWHDVNFGIAWIGTTKAWGDDANTIKLDGYVVTNAFVQYAFDEHISMTLSVSNLTNELAYTEVEGDGHAARAFDGRSATLGLRYAF